MKTLFTLSLMAIFTTAFAQQTIHVPADYNLIQDAIEASVDSDTIIVAPGEYFENINFRGKAIFLTSMFHYSEDREDINNTIINGSTPLYPDTGSVVLFFNGETEASVLKGFKITGGTGTRTYNPNENLYFRTGGGIAISAASPTIVYNIITNNESVNTEEVSGAGGGGIRVGNGNPVIRNNIISYNTGRYAGGMMIAFCSGMVLNNNVIAHNTAIGDFNGGGGLYIDWQPISIINNTIVYNHSGDDGGGIIVTGTLATVKNCIFYGNTVDSQSPDIYLRYGGTANVTYSNIEAWTGWANIDTIPEFADTLEYMLQTTSPCIDAGSPLSEFNDPEDPMAPGMAQWPALGTILNDMGAYGGPNAVPNPVITGNIEVTQNSPASLIFSNPYKNNGLILNLEENAWVEISLFSMDGKLIQQVTRANYSCGSHYINMDTTNAGKTALLVLKAGNTVSTYKISF